MSRRWTAVLNGALFMAGTCIHSTNLLCTPCTVPRSVPIQVRSGTQEPSRDKFAKHIHNKFIPDFGEVSPTLYRGAQPKKQGFEMLAEMGIQIVVDVRGDRKSEREEVTRLGMQYVPMHWQCPFPKDKIFADFITLIRANPGKKIFVHCRIGDDRTSMMVAVYRMAEEGWSAERAMEEMAEFGFSYVHRHFICIGLAGYEKNFPHRFATRPEFEKLRSSKQGQPRR